MSKEEMSVEHDLSIESRSESGTPELKAMSFQQLSDSLFSGLGLDDKTQNCSTVSCSNIQGYDFGYESLEISN
jgi:hypothetical protein